MKPVPKSAHWRQILVLFPVYINIFFVGCTIGWTPNAIYFIQKGDISVTHSQFALIVTAAEIGCLLAAIPLGLLVDQFGRKKTIIATLVVHFLSWLALSLDASFIAVFIARLLLGMGIAFENATGMITIGEIASPTIRAKLTAIYQQFFMLGQGFEIATSILFSSYFKLSYTTLAICTLFFIFLYWVLETPNHLISASKNEKAIKNLTFIRSGYTENEINSEFHSLKEYIEREKKQKLKTSWLQFITSKEILRPLCIVFIINFFEMATGYCIMRSYITVIIPENEFISTQYYPLMCFTSNLIVVFLLPFYIEQFPRRVIFMSGCIMLSLCFTLLAVTHFFYIGYSNITSRWIFTLAFFITRMIMTGTVLPMASILKGEILPQYVKGFGGSLCISAQALSNIILLKIFEFSSKNIGLYSNFIFYAANCLILLYLVHRFVPECGGKFLTDIQIEINNHVSESVDKESFLKNENYL